MMGYLLRAVHSGQMGVAGLLRESDSEQMPWAGAAAGYMPSRSSCRAMHQGWNKGRDPSPSCSMRRVMN